MELIKIKGIINFAKPYRVAEGGQTNEGITINYLMTDSLKPFENLTNGSQGYKSTKCSLPLEQGQNLTAIPGYYEMDCELDTSSQGTATLKPQVVRFLNYLELIHKDSLESKPDKPAPADDKKGAAK